MKSNAATGWRRIASAVWGPPKDPQIYGALELDATALLAFIQREREQGHHVTPTHLAGRAVARALRAVPTLNVRLVGSRAIPRGGVDVFFITSVGGGHDLAGVKVADADKKSAAEVARELDERGRNLKAGDDPEFARTKRVMEHLPHPLLRAALHASVWLAGKHALHLPALGVSSTPFGSAMVSSVGMLGLPAGFSPLAWLYTVPLLVLLGEITDKPVAVAGRVEVRPILPVTASIDHRYVDAAELATALKTFREYLQNPAAFEPLPMAGALPREQVRLAPSHT